MLNAMVEFIDSAASQHMVGSLSHNSYDNDISRMIENVLRRFSRDYLSLGGITRPFEPWHASAKRGHRVLPSRF
jgi:hypothetical protein